MRHAPFAIRVTAIALAALFFGAGCSSDDASSSSSANSATPVAARGTTPGGNDGVTSARRGTPVKVTWEALAHERYLYENPRFGRRPNVGGKPDFAIVLVNEAHPEADQIREGRVRGGQGVGSGVITNQQMKDLLAGLDQIGYFKSARGTMAQAHLFNDERARGRVTIDRPQGSVTLLSVRGQGRSESTKHIPAIYSQAKQAIAMLKNQTRTLTVETIGRDDLPYR
ncbi:MAG: hypothetical protein QNJ98_05425 [Planctomycetota bacterium]|nr:hypothetical protein [Planctomycetota bacterium]